MPAGTPRGFNLHNFGMTGMPIGFNGAQGFPAIFGNAQGPFNVGDNRGAGPIRRGGRQYQINSRSGPYDRRPNQRYGGDAGRSSPPGSRRVGVVGGGGGRWGDGAAGGAAVGPREAVQGRILKSYEDLDAVAGGGGGELNY